MRDLSNKVFETEYATVLKDFDTLLETESDGVHITNIKKEMEEDAQ